MNKTTDGVPIAVVEQETGLSKDVLRKWELRYNYPVPVRNAQGGRLYSREQVAHLRTIKRLMDGGYRPSKLFEMDPGQWVELAVSQRPNQPAADSENAVSELLALLKAHQPAQFRAALTRLLQGQGLKRFVQDTMAPLSSVVGEAWSRGELRVFEEHLFSDIASAILRQAYEALDAPEGRPRILMTTLPGEVHALGLRMAACLFAMQGAHCIYLGTEMPGEDIAQAVEAHRADVVALSFSSAFPARNIQPALLGLRQKISANIQILAGGVGVRRQKPLLGIRFMKDFASIDEYVAKYSAE